MSETPGAFPGSARSPGGPARPTLASLARAAGVAVSTVSRALNDDPRISPAVRQRIAELAAAAGYTPDPLARTLVGGRSGLIGVVLGPMENPFYAELLQSIVEETSARSMRPLLLHAGPGPIERSTADALLQYRVDGCLITSAGLSSHAASVCAAGGVPMVMINRVARLHGRVVACDNRGGGAELAAFLLAGGHRRYAVIAGNADSSSSLERAEGFAGRLLEAGLPAPRVLPGGASHAAGYAAGKAIAMLPSVERPDAVFGVSDILAMGVMDALRTAGLRVPEEISVVGFDGIAAGEAEPYRLTTVRQPAAAMVARGLEMLLSPAAGEVAVGEVVRLPGRLEVRGSARRPMTAMR